jgi:hypothetical protein
VDQEVNKTLCRKKAQKAQNENSKGNFQDM